MIEEKFLEYINLCKKLDYSFCEEIIEYYINILNLKTVNNITFDNNDRTYYEPLRKKINLNINELHKIANFHNYGIPSMHMQTLYINSELLGYLLHEIVHAKQKNIVNRNEKANELIISILKKSFRRAHFYKKIYEEFHDCFVIEHNANVESQLMVKDFLDKLNLEFNPYQLNFFLNYGYNTISPVEREANLVKQQYKTINLDSLSDYEKIIYGFPIEEEKIIIKN